MNTQLLKGCDDFVSKNHFSNCYSIVVCKEYCSGLHACGYQFKFHKNPPECLGISSAQECDIKPTLLAPKKNCYSHLFKNGLPILLVPHISLWLSGRVSDWSLEGYGFDSCQELNVLSLKCHGRNNLAENSVILSDYILMESLLFCVSGRWMRLAFHWIKNTQ